MAGLAQPFSGGPLRRVRPLEFAAIALVVAGFAAAGCAKKKVPPPPAPAPPPAVVQQQPPPPAPRPAPTPPPVAPEPPRTLTDDEVFASKSLDALNAEQPLSHVAFELDSYSLDEAARGVID